VGKSTLFNRLVGARQALVDDRPGVTRDRNYGVTEWQGREVVVVDTGGFEPNPSELEQGDLFRVVRVQAEAAIEEADVVLFVVDRQSGLTPADKLTADFLRKALGKKKKATGEESSVLLVVNKCDSPQHEQDASEFWSMGMTPMLCVSAEHGREIYELWEHIEERLPVATGEPEQEDDGEIRIAVIGRPNIGKSTLVNQLVGEDRQVVHDSPGTTMDSIDSVVHVGEQVFRIVDTAGVRRKARISDSLETFAVARAIKTIERCHVTLLMIDGVEGVSKQDARLAALVADRGRACIVLVNRWDLVKGMEERNYGVVTDELEQALPHIRWAPMLAISALTGKGTHRIFSLVNEVFEQFGKRITTAKLNQFLLQTVAEHSPPQRHHHPVRLNYMTQARVRPPWFIIWSNSPDGVKTPYKRFLENRLRDAFGFEGTPVRIRIRQKRKPGEARWGESNANEERDG